MRVFRALISYFFEDEVVVTECNFNVQQFRVGCGFGESVLGARGTQLLFGPALYEEDVWLFVVAWQQSGGYGFR